MKETVFAIGSVGAWGEKKISGGKGTLHQTAIIR